MMIKYLPWLLIVLSLTGCEGEADAQKKQAVAPIALAQKSYAQQKAFEEALSIMSSKKTALMSQMNAQQACIAQDESHPYGHYIDHVTVKSDCTIEASFKDSPFMPDLKGEYLSLKIERKKGFRIWACHFSGQSQDLPPYCHSA